MAKFRMVPNGLFVEYLGGKEVTEHSDEIDGYPVFGSGGRFGYSAESLYDGQGALLGRKGTIDKPQFIEGKFWLIDTAYFARPNSEALDPKFFYYSATTFPFHLISTNTARPSTTAVDLARQKIPLPDLDTQRRIVNYLDAETTQIDTLVAELDEYVELLERRKDRLIEDKIKELSPPLYAVGLIGNILLGKMVTSRPASDTDELRPYLRAAHVQPGGVLDFSVKEKEMWFTQSEIQNLDLKAGDVVVVEGGAGYGRSCYLTEDLEGWGFQNSINRIRPIPGLAQGEYVSLMINRALMRGEITVATNVATIPHFTAEKLARFRIPVPCVEEQKEFLDQVMPEFSRTNTLITQCQELKELLLKRHQVLITDVVTGKVEV